MKLNLLTTNSINTNNDHVKQLQDHRKQTALFMARQKFALLPLRPKSKIPYIELLPSSRQGQASWSLYQLRPPSESEIKDWFLYDPECNYGIITGQASGGLYVLDVDQPRKLPKGKGKELPATVTVKTGRGCHYYFYHEEELTGKTFPFGDLKGEGGYIVGPGSIHENGQVYGFYELLSPADIEIEKLPQWIGNFEASRAPAPTYCPETLIKQSSTTKDLKTYKPLKPGEGVRKNSLTCSPSFDQLWRLNQDPATAFKIMALCGREVDRIGKAFTCPIPGHSERKPSAALWQGDSEGDAVVFHDFHEREAGRFTWPLVDVYASVKVGKALKLQKGERAIWWLRALHEIGAVNPPVLKGYELPGDVNKQTRKLYNGFIYLLELRQLYSPQDSAPFSWSFAGRWCGIKSAKYIQKAMAYLLETGFLYMKQPGVKIGEGEGPRSALFAIGRPKM